MILDTGSPAGSHSAQLSFASRWHSMSPKYDITLCRRAEKSVPHPGWCSLFTLCAYCWLLRCFLGIFLHDVPTLRSRHPHHVLSRKCQAPGPCSPPRLRAWPSEPVGVRALLHRHCACREFTTKAVCYAQVHGSSVCVSQCTCTRVHAWPSS